MRRTALILLIAVTAVGCGVDLYESPDFGTVDAGEDVVLWRLSHGPAGFVGIGGPIQPEDLEEDAGPLTLGSYLSADGRTWERGEILGSIEAPLLGLTGFDGGYAASGTWEGTPAVMVSGDGLTWTRFELPTGPTEIPGIESAGIAAYDGRILVTGYTEAPPRAVLWSVDPASGPTLVDASVLPADTRLPQAVAGPAGFVISAVGATPESTPPPIWVSENGIDWNPVLDPFDSDAVVTGLIGSPDGYVAVVATDGSDERFTLWTSTDGIDWTRRADQDSVFGYLAGKGGVLIQDLSMPPTDAPQTRPIAFSLNGRWLEITEAVAGDRFVAVAVAADGQVRLLSGFTGGSEPVPLVLLADH